MSEKQISSLTRRRTLQSAAAATVVIAAPAIAQSKETFNLRIGAGAPSKPMPHVNACEKFFVPETTKRVRERTGHELKWTEAYGGAIAKLPEILDATKAGLLDVGAVGVAFHPSQLMAHNVSYWFPFNSPDPGVVNRATRKTYETVSELKELYESRYNQKFLACAPVGNYQLGTTFAWARLEELQGKKIQAAGPNLDMLEGTGAVPVQGAVTEAYNGLQTGVFDGAIMFPGSYAGFKLHEVAPHLKLVDFGAVTFANLTMNLRTWRSLPPEIQEIIVEVANEYEHVAARLQAEHDQAGLEVLRKEAQVTDLPVDERRRWAELLVELPARRAKEADAAGFPGTRAAQAYLRAMIAEGHQFPVEYSIG
jgi:TRAP-type C4-dicarboxylate transport system substrate-binding protein